MSVFKSSWAVVARTTKAHVTVTVSKHGNQRRARELCDGKLRRITPAANAEWMAEREGKQQAV